MEYPHGVAQRLLCLEVRIGIGVIAAKRCHQVMQIQRERRPSVVSWMTLPRDLLIFQVSIFDDLVKIEVDPLASEPGDGYVWRRDRDVHWLLHAIAQQRPQGRADTGDCPKVSH